MRARKPTQRALQIISDDYDDDDDVDTIPYGQTVWLLLWVAASSPYTDCEPQENDRFWRVGIRRQDLSGESWLDIRSLPVRLK